MRLQVCLESKCLTNESPKADVDLDKKREERIERSWKYTEYKYCLSRTNPPAGKEVCSLGTLSHMNVGLTGTKANADKHKSDVGRYPGAVLPGESGRWNV